MSCLSVVVGDDHRRKDIARKKMEIFTIDGSGGEVPTDGEDQKTAAAAAAGDQPEMKSVRRRRLLKQGVKIFFASLGLWTYGSVIAFPSVVAHDLTFHNTTYFGSTIFLTSSLLDLLGSLAALGSLPGSWLISVVMVVKGRRFGMMVSGLVAVVGWLGVALLSSKQGLLAARFVSGLAIGCLSVCVNTYAAEVSDTEVRGVMGAMLTLGIVLGQLFTMGVGYDARYYMVAITNIILPLVFLLSISWLPESPGFLVLNGCEDQARQVLRDLRGQHADLELEIRRYRDLNRGHEKLPVWRGLLKPSVLKSIAVVVMLFFFQNFSGYLVINTNASRIFAQAGSSISGNLCAIIIMFVQILSGVASFFLLDTIGRKKSLILSCVITLVPLVTITAYVSVMGDGDAGLHRYGWLPVVCLMTSQAGVVMGLQVVPFLFMSEYFPTWIRSQAVSICRSTATLFSFLSLQLYTPMLEGLTKPGVYAFYSFVCLLGIPFTIIFVRETKGKNIG